jgi:hypothetical protein
MVVAAAIASVLTVGIAFYVRFFVALCKDSKRRWTGYFLRIEPGQGGYPLARTQPKPRQPSVTKRQPTCSAYKHVYASLDLSPALGDYSEVLVRL